MDNSSQTAEVSTKGSSSIRYCNGVMGVPITFLDKYNPEQFEIVAFRKGEDGKDLVFSRERESSTVLSYPYQEKINWPPQMFVDGKKKFFRILIKKK